MPQKSNEKYCTQCRQREDKHKPLLAKTEPVKARQDALGVDENQSTLKNHIFKNFISFFLGFSNVKGIISFGALLPSMSFLLFVARAGAMSAPEQ